MNSIRKLVSGNRRRINEGDYSLDLTYITPRIVAMGYPSAGFESFYRNPIEKVIYLWADSKFILSQVSAYFNEKHKDKYYIINTSERATYDKQKYFGGRVSEYHWPDHHGPPFAFLYQIAEQAYNWLKGKWFTLTHAWLVL